MPPPLFHLPSLRQLLLQCQLPVKTLLSCVLKDAGKSNPSTACPFVWTSTDRTVTPFLSPRMVAQPVALPNVWMLLSWVTAVLHHSHLSHLPSNLPNVFRHQAVLLLAQTWTRPTRSVPPNVLPVHQWIARSISQSRPPVQFWNADGTFVIPPPLVWYSSTKEVTVLLRSLSDALLVPPICAPVPDQLWTKPSNPQDSHAMISMEVHHPLLKSRPAAGSKFLLAARTEAPSSSRDQSVLELLSTLPIQVDCHSVLRSSFVSLSSMVPTTDQVMLSKL